MDCAETREHFSALLDGELDPATRATVEGHLSTCSDCLRELGALKRVDTLYRQLSKEPVPADFAERVRGALRPRLVRLARGAWSRRVVWPLAAAAMLVVVGSFYFTSLQQSSLAPMMASAPQASEPPQEEVAGRKVRVDSVQPDLESKVAAGKSASPAEETADAQQRQPFFALNGVSEEETKEKAASVMAGSSGGGVERRIAVGALEIGNEPMIGAQTEAVAEAAPAAPTLAAAPAQAAPASASDKTAGDTLAFGGQYTLSTKSAAGRTFELKDDTWRESTYADESTTELIKDSEAYQQLAKEHTELADIAKIGDRVIFRLGETWYALKPSSGQ